MLIQAFTVNESSVTDGLGFLHLSHEGVSSNRYRSVILLRNSIFDPVTGSIQLKLLDDSLEHHHFICDDLTLPKSSGDDTLPITVVVDEKFTNVEIPPQVKIERCINVGYSDSGNLRGFFRTLRQGQPQVSLIMKFAIDVTQDESTLSFGELLLPNLDHIEDRNIGRIHLDVKEDGYALLLVIDSYIQINRCDRWLLLT